MAATFLTFTPTHLFEQALQANAGGFDFILFLRNVINGLGFGGIYALVALGIVLIHKSSDVVNFGHGEMTMFCTYIGFAVAGVIVQKNDYGEIPKAIPFGQFALVVLVTLAFAAAMGFAIEGGLLRPLQKASILSQVMITIGIAALLFGLASWIWNPEPKAYPSLDSIYGRDANIRAGDLIVPYETLVFLGVGLALAVVLFLFFKYTLVGAAMRAMAQNRLAARLMGINVGRLNGATWAIALMLAAIAGILAAPRLQLEPTMMLDVAVKAFAAAVLGGINSLLGAIVGGLLIGIIDNLVGFYLRDNWDGLRSTVAFLIIVLVLTLKPNGLFGHAAVKKV